MDFLEIQGLSRFRRSGLENVKLVFGLHLLAYNLSRAVKAVIYAILWLNKLLCWLFEKYWLLDRKWVSRKRNSVKPHTLQRRELYCI